MTKSDLAVTTMDREEEYQMLSSDDESDQERLDYLNDQFPDENPFEGEDEVQDRQEPKKKRKIIECKYGQISSYFFLNLNFISWASTKARERENQSERALWEGEKERNSRHWFLEYRFESNFFICHLTNCFFTVQKQ